MKKRTSPLFFLVPLLAALLGGCAAKLTTVRPGDVYLRIERLSDGALVEMPDSAEQADTASVLVLQLEEPYRETGSCTGEEGHKYAVALVRVHDEKVEMECCLNADGSVCKGGKRYVPTDKADKPVDIALWDAYFDAVYAGAGPVLFAAAGEGAPMGIGVEILTAVPAEEADGWSYFVGDLRMDGAEWAAVWRTAPQKEGQVLFALAQPTEETALRHRAEYAPGSFAAGEGGLLYFTAVDGATFHRSLWCFAPEALAFRRVLAGPCSNMVVLPSDAPALAGLGWVVQGQRLVAIDLSAAAEKADMSVPLTEYTGEGLFYGIGDFGTHKFVNLNALGGAALEIESVVAEPATSAPEKKAVWQIDCLTHKFSAVE